MVLVVRGITALGTMGINVTALATDLRLTGFSLGFILKNMFSNVLSSFLILFYEPFGINDRITVSNVLEKLLTFIFDIRFYRKIVSKLWCLILQFL
ncbi:mechanosensitive ion channel domain-containing protein [Candidatus Coxiella mudrowiae]|uniref:mechanosensitive ion channel domain-containing protein n=1 Tax=Candidatus Coxiella mudrowiae TaxID=2054173 RepID=UPI000B142166|nr:mechanosensitive ion channel domain-containing protein [Candidatus Coxiella mudrowiae]